MHNFNDYIKRRIPKMTETAIKLNELLSDKFDTVVRKTTMLIEFYTLQFNESAELIVPVGTKDEPAGISRINDSYIIITHTDNKPLYYVHSEELKAWIKANYPKLQKVHSEDYKMAVLLKYGELADNAESKQPIFFNI